MVIANFFEIKILVGKKNIALLKLVTLILQL